MYSKTPPSLKKKRPHEEGSTERPRKSPFGVVKVEDDAFGEPKMFKFRVLLPNGTTLDLKLSELRNEMPIEEFVDVVRKEYLTVAKQGASQQLRRRINWKYQDLHFTAAHKKKIRIKVDFRDFVPNKWHFLWLHDGSAEPDAYEDMWDLTPDTDLLKELPDDYTFETALADLIDNSLQALWSNDKRETRLISVELHPDKISIFDSGPGMDGADGNLVKWGKMGASMHRSVREKAIGGKPPYLMPFFGMFGYGGPVATMCLGRRAVVSSKTKNCDKVFTLHLEREALMNASSSENCWKTRGGLRDPSEDEKQNSGHGSFTKVEIFEPKMKALDMKPFQCKLKDIYFPYIQCDEMSGKTSRPVIFQVNGDDLAEVQGGEVATTNLHSSHGPNFILQLRFSINQDPSSMLDKSGSVLAEANARLKCVYFPIVEGEESIKRIIDALDVDGCGIKESFEGFSRVSIRRLGRLLPDARWAMLPFMEPKQRIGEKAQILKRCCSRVKSFIDTDSGFNPTRHKTDLAQHHPYTKALKTFFNRTPEKNEQDVQIEISRDGKKLTACQLEKQYNDWISDMHDRYDDEIDGGLDEATIVVVSSKIKKLGIESEVLRIHKKIERRGTCWTAGQKIKILRGACPGCHKSNVFATLQYIILEGLPGDVCGK